MKYLLLLVAVCLGMGCDEQTGFCKAIEKDDGEREYKRIEVPHEEYIKDFVNVVDYQCVDNCSAKGYAYKYCERFCSY